MRSSSIIEQSNKEVGLAQAQISQSSDSAGLGAIAVVGLGPGSLDDMTPNALKTIQDADIVVGYTTYIKLIETLLTDKQVIGTAMMQEVKRCSLAVEQAVAGKKVAVISSGDSGIYGMAGLILELILQHPAATRPAVKIVPGISAVSAAASILGAPLMHDFAVISLSDLLTPWELIKKRLELIAQGDFVVAIYNPKSKKRVTQIEEVRTIMLKHKAPSTPVGIVQNATRPEQSVTLSTLDDFTNKTIDMFSLVIIGNSQTFVKDNFMITPRGYKL